MHRGMAKNGLCEHVAERTAQHAQCGEHTCGSAQDKSSVSQGDRGGGLPMDGAARKRAVELAHLLIASVRRRACPQKSFVTKLRKSDKRMKSLYYNLPEPSEPASDTAPWASCASLCAPGAQSTMPISEDDWTLERRLDHCRAPAAATSSNAEVQNQVISSTIGGGSSSGVLISLTCIDSSAASQGLQLSCHMYYDALGGYLSQTSGAIGMLHRQSTASQ